LAKIREKEAAMDKLANGNGVNGTNGVKRENVNGTVGGAG
jgi:hypothetical protein